MRGLSLRDGRIVNNGSGTRAGQVSCTCLQLMLGCLLLARALSAQGASGVVSVDFGGNGTNPSASSETAGVVAKGNWNHARGAQSASPLSLVDETGSATDVKVNWTSDNIPNTPDSG